MPKLFIAMPNSGTIATPTLRSLLRLTDRLKGLGLAYELDTYSFSDIVFSRNTQAARFLGMKEASHLIFIDSDMEFAPEAVLRLLRFPAPLTAAAYPRKMLDLQAFRDLALREAQRPEAEQRSTAALLAELAIYNHSTAAFGGKKLPLEMKDGFLRIVQAGTGLMCLHRSVLETMIAKGVARPYPRMSSVPLYRDLKFHDFFGHLPDDEGTVLYGEDGSFCKRWTDGCGGEIWLDTTSVITHWGQRGFAGHYADKLLHDFPELAQHLEDAEKQNDPGRRTIRNEDH